MKLYVVRSLVIAWVTVTFYVSVTLWSRTGVMVDTDDMVLNVVVGRPRRPHEPHSSLQAAVDSVLAHRRVLAEVKAKHLQMHEANRTKDGWQRYFQYKAIGDHIWPTTSDERDDRILNQLHLTHQDPAGQPQLLRTGFCLVRTTWVSWYQKGEINLDLLEHETVSGSGISCAVCKSAPHSPHTDNHASTPPLSFLQAGCPSCCPINSVKALKASRSTAK